MFYGNRIRTIETIAHDNHKIMKAESSMKDMLISGLRESSAHQQTEILILQKKLAALLEHLNVDIKYPSKDYTVTGKESKS